MGSADAIFSGQVTYRCSPFGQPPSRRPSARVKDTESREYRVSWSPAPVSRASTKLHEEVHAEPDPNPAPNPSPCATPTLIQRGHSISPGPPEDSSKNGREGGSELECGFQKRCLEDPSHSALDYRRVDVLPGCYDNKCAGVMCIIYFNSVSWTLLVETRRGVRAPKVFF